MSKVPIKLVFATHNANKYREVRAQLPSEIDLLYLADLTHEAPVEETAQSLRDNALLKMDAVVQTTGMNCFADDTGLEVMALNGAPGVYSARYAGPKANAEENMAKLLNSMVDLEDRRAQFRTVIALSWNGVTHYFEGICSGHILRQPRGMSGFGYDPIFQPLGHDRTFAQMTLAEKSVLSHRGLAMNQLMEWLRDHLK